MKSLKILASLISLFGVFSFMHVSAMEKNPTQKLMKDEKNAKPFEFNERDKCIVFNLNSNTTEYGNDMLRLKLGKKYKDNSEKSEIVDDFKKFYNEYVKTMSTSEDEFFELFKIENIKNIGHNSPDYDKFTIYFKDISFLTQDSLEILKGNNLKRVKYINNIKNIVGFLNFIVDKFLKNSNWITKREYELNITPKDEYHKEKIQKDLIENKEYIKKVKNTKFNGEDEDLFNFYVMSYNVLAKRYAEPFQENSLFNPSNVEHIRYVDGDFKVYFKFKDSLDFNDRIKLALLPERQYSEFINCLIREVMIVYVENMKKVQLNSLRNIQKTKRFRL